MWKVAAGLCAAQLWALLGLLPALGGDPVVAVWTGLATLSLAAGAAALPRHNDAAVLLLGLVLPVTLVPAFVVGRNAAPLLTSPLVQLVAGLVLAALLLSLARARHDPPPPSTRLRATRAALPARERYALRTVRVAALVMTTVWVALPLRALVDPSLMARPLAAVDPVEAKILLLALSWPAAVVLVLVSIVPAVADASAPSTHSRRLPLGRMIAGLLLLAAWGGLVWAGA